MHKSRRRPSVVVFGDINIDWVVSLPRLDVELRDVQVHDSDLIRERVGGAGVALAIASHAAGSNVTLIGCVGSDLCGQLAIKELKHHRIRSVISKSSKAQTGRVFMAYGNSRRSRERAMLSHRGANTLLTLTARARTAIERADLVVASGYTLLEAPQSASVLSAIRMARRFGIPTILDVVPHEVARRTLPHHYREALDEVSGVCVELGTARRLLGIRATSAEATATALAQRFRVVILRPENEREIVCINGRLRQENTGYRNAKHRTGYLDAVMGRQLVNLLLRGELARSQQPRTRRRT